MDLKGIQFLIGWFFLALVSTHIESLLDSVCKYLLSSFGESSRGDEIFPASWLVTPKATSVETNTNDNPVGIEHRLIQIGHLYSLD